MAAPARPTLQSQTSTDLPSPPELFDKAQLFQELGHRDERTRQGAALRLHRYVLKTAQQLEASELEGFMNLLCKDVAHLLQSHHKFEKMGGIAAVSEIIKIDHPGVTTPLIINQFAQYFKVTVLPPNTNDAAIFAKTAVVVGKLARKAGTMATRFVEMQCDQAVDWLQSSKDKPKSDGVRLCASLLLHEISQAQPAEYFKYIPDVLQHIFVALFDLKVTVRTAAQKTLSSTLELWRDRALYPSVYNRIERGLSAKKEEVVHGALLAASAFVELTGDYLKDTYYFEVVCDSALELRRHKSPLVQRELLILLPKLAANCPTKFISYQHKAATYPFARGALDFILAAANREKDKAVGLHALGKLASALGSELRAYLADVRNVLGDLRSLLLKAMVARNTNDAVLAASCTCIGYLAHAMIAEIKLDLTRPHAKEEDERSLLDLLFDLPLTKSLIQALVMVTDSLVWLEQHPSTSKQAKDDGIHASTVKRRLLDLLCITIQGAPYCHPGNPDSAEVHLQPTLGGPIAPRSRRTSVAKEGALTPTSTPKLRRGSKFPKDQEPVRMATSVAALVLALDTLRSYNFHEFVLTTLARDAISQYLSHSNDDVRQAAGLTCAALVVPQTSPQHYGRVDPLAVADVLSQLLTNAISERKAGIRRRILQALPRVTDTYLVRTDTLQLLLICLHDRDHQTQLTALEVVGRLCDLNPAYVIPALRRQLQNILNSFVLTESTTSEEFNARLLSHLISVAPRVVAPYVDAVMKALLPRLDHSNEAIQVAALGAVGALSVFSGLQLDIHLAVIMPVLLSALKDQVSQRRRFTALRVLGQLARGTTYVTVPYEDYPSLMKGLYTCYTEGQTDAIRLEAARVLGILGALDPYRERDASGTADADEQALQAKMDGQQGPLPTNSQHATANAPEEQQFDVGSEEYYADIVIRELYQTAYSPAMDKMHEAVGQALGMVVINMKLAVVRYLPMIVPAYLHMVEFCNPTGRHKMFKEISTLIDTFGEHVRPYMDDIIHHLTQHWFPLNEVSARALSGTIHPVARAVIRSSMQALGRSFKKYVPGLLAHIMAVIPLDQTDGRVITVQGLDAISLLGALVEDRVYPVVRALVLVFAAYVGMPANVRRQALNTLELLMAEIPLGDQASGVFNSLLRVIRHEPSIRTAAISALRPLIVQLGLDFESRGHKRALLKLVEDVELVPQDREALISLAETGIATQLPPTQGKAVFKPLRDVFESNPQKSDSKLTESVVRLCRAAGNSKNFDWQAWIKRFCVTLVQHSKSHTLRACQFLASKFDLFARRIFNAAFVSTWKELTETQRREMADALQNAMYADHVFMQMMLNVAEFMSHSFSSKNEPLLTLPFTTTTLGTMALDCHAYAKALRYKEDELRLFFNMADLNAGVARLPVEATDELLQAVEDLIEISQSLQQAEAAQGVLTFVRLQTDLSAQSIIQPSWYEKLGEWDKAMSAYSNQIELELQAGHFERKFELEVRAMVCLDNLGKWDILRMELDRSWHVYTEDERRDVAPLGCSAACGMALWDNIVIFLNYMPPEDPLTHFYAAVYAVHVDDHATAYTHIDLSRTLLHPTLSTLWGESYSRGYSHVVTLQRLAELEEVMQYKQLDHDPAAQDRIRQMWNVRLNGCQSNPAVWQRVLEVRSLVLEPAEDARMWLKYASLCRKASGLGSAQNYSRIGLDRSHNTLVSMLGVDPSLELDCPIPMDTPAVTYAYIKHVWVSGERDEAVAHLYSLIEHLSVAAQSEARPNPEHRRLLARCYHKLGLWKAEPHLTSAGTVNSDLTDEMMDPIIESFRYATLYDRSWYKAWHSWAYMNYEAVKHFQGRDREQRYLSHSIKSIKGFFNSIALSQNSNLQDTLRLLTLLFTHGSHDDVVNVFAEGLATVPIDTWLQVIPQLIARIQIRDPQIRGLLNELLLQVGRKHAQALVFPLTVAAQNHKESAMRRDAAKNLLNRLRQHSQQLVEQAVMVADELIRVAVLWEEMWFEGIEEASKFYTDRQVDAMFAVLMPLHQQLNDGNQDRTVREAAFLQLYGKDLRDAYEWLRKYQRTEDKQDITAAWDQYFHVYRAISKGLEAVNTLELKEVSPRLLDAEDLELVVPGTYDHNEPDQITIGRFIPQLRVIRSKQRPRRLTVQGSDGEDHEYLLKAHEDLRQDERVMQLFNLVNVLLAKDTSTFNKHLHIFTYFVLPLSPKLGLIQWVPTCDTMHSLIREHRERTGILLNKELRMMLQMTSNVDQLTLIQKVEVFRHGLSQTKGDDLACILWQRSSSSEEWLERRGNFIRSLAVMSMVGYVLGLGDRHPSNLMIDRKTGGVMHVDFGDCFEVAINRPKYPERVPFRLTRMLVSAMEVSGVHGTFSITCENTMSVLRNNSDSVMAVLEAFVHDPLIDWFTKSRPEDRLGDPGQSDGPNEEPNEKAVEVIERVKDKLSGTDFPANPPDGLAMDVSKQVTRLIRDATMHENLCQHYTGWCPFW